MDQIKVILAFGVAAVSKKVPFSGKITLVLSGTVDTVIQGGKLTGFDNFEFADAEVVKVTKNVYIKSSFMKSPC